jgi:hypothetical protein
VEATASKTELEQPKPEAGNSGGSPEEDPLKGAEIAHDWAKLTALVTLVAGFLYCVLLAGLAGWSHGTSFQAAANFALFAGFVVIAGAIERMLEPLLIFLPPFEKKPDPKNPSIKEENEKAKADRALLAYSIALIAGIAFSSVFGLYFLEAVGAQISGDKALRGLDIFVTALIITGGTKPLHDMITSIEKKKENLAKAS